MTTRAEGQHFGAVDGAALVVATVVGAGIFTVPGYVASLAGTGWLSVGLWALGGLLAMAGALCYAELAARYPRSGAEYVYLREAFGDRAGFLSGWTSLIAGFSGAIAAAAVGFGDHIVAAVPVLTGQAGAGSGATTTILALALIWVCTAISMSGARMSRLATNLLTGAILVGMVVLAAAGILKADIALASTFSPTSAALGALVPIFFTYSGWNAAAYVTAEFRNPSRDVPRALIGGTALVTLLYVGVNIATLRVLHVSPAQGDLAPVAHAARTLLGGLGSAVVLMLALAALSSSVCAMIITGPRIYQAMADDGVLPRVLATRHGGSPRASILTQSVWSSLLVLTGTFEQLVTYTGFAIVLFSGATVCALAVLRRRHGAPTTFRVPWYPVIPFAFIATTAFIAIASFRYAPGPSVVGLLLIAAGLPLRRFARTRPASVTAVTSS